MTATSTTPRAACAECNRPTRSRFPILDLALCRACQRAHPDRYGFVTKTRALREHRLRETDLATLESFAMPNPHYKTGPHDMQLFLRRHVEAVAARKWGSAEPYRVALVPFPANELRRLLEDDSRLSVYSPGRFEELIADRLERWGMEARIVGAENRRDGGIDIVAWPRRSVVPYLVGVQAKHHRFGANTGAPDVRNFLGALTSRANHIHVGMIVTNTGFTADAQWFANQNSQLLRLRDLGHLRRWLQDDFDNEFEWREIPGAIELAPGIVVTIPRNRS